MYFKGIDGKEYSVNEVTESGAIGCKHRTHEEKKSSPSRFGELHSWQNALVKAVLCALSGKECAPLAQIQVVPRVFLRPVLEQKGVFLLSKIKSHIKEKRL